MIPIPKTRAEADRALCHARIRLLVASIDSSIIALRRQLQSIPPRHESRGGSNGNN